MHVHAPADLVGRVAEHDHARRDAGHRGQGVLEQRAAVQLGELLGAAEPPPLAGGEDQPADRHTPTSWIRPCAWASRPPARPWRMATISPMIDSAVSSAVSEPRSRPIGAADALELGLLDALGEQPLAALGLRAARAHGADVAGVRAQRQHQRGVVELRVVREDGDRGRAVDAAELVERVLRPRGDDLLGVREPRRLREAGPRVDHERPPACGLGERAECGREVDRAEDDQPRRRVGDVDEQVAVALGALGPHQLVAELRRLLVEIGLPQGAGSSRRRRG